MKTLFFNSRGWGGGGGGDKASKGQAPVPCAILKPFEHFSYEIQVLKFAVLSGHMHIYYNFH